jgi:hypothetical protein
MTLDSKSVTDNARCHTVQKNKPPTTYTRKADIIIWL